MKGEKAGGRPVAEVRFRSSRVSQIALAERQAQRGIRSVLRGTGVHPSLNAGSPLSVLGRAKTRSDRKVVEQEPLAASFPGIGFKTALAFAAAVFVFGLTINADKLKTAASEIASGKPVSVSISEIVSIPSPAFAEDKVLVAKESGGEPPKLPEAKPSSKKKPEAKKSGSEPEGRLVAKGKTSSGTKSGDDKVVLASVGTSGVPEVSRVVTAQISGNGNDIDFEKGTPLEEALGDLEHYGYENVKVFYGGINDRLAVVFTDGVPKGFTFLDGAYSGTYLDLTDVLVEGAEPTNIAYASIKTGQFVTGEGFIVEINGQEVPAVAFLGEQGWVSTDLSGVVEEEGGMKNPVWCKAFQERGKVLLHAENDEGEPWKYAHIFDTTTGESTKRVLYSKVEKYFERELASR